MRAVDNSIVGRGGWPDHWAPGYAPVRHHSSVDYWTLAAGIMIGFGLGLFVGVWARWRSNGR